jgi:hypothetical protein
MTLYLTLALVIVFIILFSIPKVRRFAERHQILTNFLLTLVATFLGVFWSIQATEVQNQKQSKEEAIRLLDTLTKDARSKLTTAQDSQLSAPEDRRRPDEALYPTPIRELVLRDISLRNYSPEFIVTINRYTVLLESYMNTYRKDDLVITEDFRPIYIDMLKKLVVLMELEKFYLRGEIDREVHDLLYRCFFEGGRGHQSEKISQQSQCKDDLLKMKGRIPPEFWTLKELDN